MNATRKCRTRIIQALLTLWGKGGSRPQQQPFAFIAPSVSNPFFSSLSIQRNELLNPNTKIRIPFILFLAVGWTAATAASFDCAKAATYVETAICDNQDLSRLDEDAAHLFAEAIKRNVGTEAELRENQKAWLKKRNQCGTEDCILSTYLDRRGWYFSQMISVTSAQDDFRRASEIAQGSKLHLVLYGTPELGRDEGSAVP